MAPLGARWIGALYLIYLAVRTLIQGARAAPQASHGGQSKRRVYRDGLLVNLFNPKVSILMLALLPQFLAPEAGHVPLQILLFGSMHALIASLVLISLAITTGHAASAIRERPGVQRVLRWASGILLLGFGTRLILVDR